jgi:integrase
MSVPVHVHEPVQVSFNAASPALSELAADPNISPLLAKHFDAAALLAERSVAERTLETYEDAWKRFRAYCDAAGQLSLPADPTLVAAWLASMAFAEIDTDGTRAIGTGLHPSTIAVRLAAVNKAHIVAGFEAPGTSPAVSLVMRGLRREFGTRPRRPAQPLVWTMLERCLDATLEPSYVALRDRLALLMLRDDEVTIGSLARLDWSDVVLGEETMQAFLPAAGRNRQPLSLSARCDRSATCMHCAAIELATHVGATVGPVFTRSENDGTGPNPEHLSREALRSRVATLVARSGGSWAPAQRRSVP